MCAFKIGKCLLVNLIFLTLWYWGDLDYTHISDHIWFSVEACSFQHKQQKRTQMLARKLDISLSSLLCYKSVWCACSETLSIWHRYDIEEIWITHIIGGFATFTAHKMWSWGFCKIKSHITRNVVAIYSLLCGAKIYQSDQKICSHLSICPDSGSIILGL